VDDHGSVGMMLSMRRLLVSSVLMLVAMAGSASASATPFAPAQPHRPEPVPCLMASGDMSSLHVQCGCMAVPCCPLTALRWSACWCPKRSTEMIVPVCCADVKAGKRLCRQFFVKPEARSE